ncbi:hypothetical protein [Aliagarivorans taiwanensis]|uniref:hypothetical protein n=1 Tax=Aliagarivorans taiwanensis TaxID=561966 RepID=UPI0003F6F9DE|nr:hypothetical protein [Aliagarivorans taiwanensis]
MKKEINLVGLQRPSDAQFDDTGARVINGIALDGITLPKCGITFVTTGDFAVANATQNPSDDSEEAQVNVLTFTMIYDLEQSNIRLHEEHVRRVNFVKVGNLAGEMNQLLRDSIERWIDQQEKQAPGFKQTLVAQDYFHLNKGEQRLKYANRNSFIAAYPEVIDEIVSLEQLKHIGAISYPVDINGERITVVTILNDAYVARKENGDYQAAIYGYEGPVTFPAPLKNLLPPELIINESQLAQKAS